MDSSRFSITDQAQNFISIAEKTLSKGGTGILSLKAPERSIDGEDESRFARAESLLRQSSLDFIERIEIDNIRNSMPFSMSGHRPAVPIIPNPATARP